MSFAVEMYITTGIGLRTLAKKMLNFFKIKISYEGIRQWVLASKSLISRREIIVPTVWHADETYIKIKGVGHWLWLVYCKNTKQILSWHISKTRLYEDAYTVLKKALELAGVRPEKIITDGLWQYSAAIYKVMAWHWREHKKRHIVDSGIGKNAIIERLNREVKRRIKWFSTFQSMEGAQVFIGLWCYHHNTQHLT